MAGSKKTTAAAGDAHEEILTLAHRLNLTALPLALSELLQKAQDQGVSYTEFTLWLLRSEVQTRGTRSMQRNLKRSRLGRVEGLDGFDFSLRPKLPASVVGELMHCRWVTEHRNIICVGRPGTGKTRIVKALGQAAVLQGHRVLYVQTAHMLADLHAALADHSFQRALRRYLKPQVLICDSC